MGNEDCPDAAAPLCEPDSGECVSCSAVADGDGACAQLDPATPLCVGDRCVACTADDPLVCDQQLLVCDDDTHACVPCGEHEECGSGACELALGRCFPTDFVVTVDGDGGAMADYMSIAAAVDAVDDGQHGVIVVHELDMAAPYALGVQVTGGKTIALLAAPGEAPIIQGTGGNPGLRVEGAGTSVYVDGLSIAGNTGGLGLAVDGASAWVDRSRIVQNSGGGILAQNGAELTLRNCFVVLNGGQFVDTRGLTASNAIIRLAYTTVAANDGTGATGPISIACDAGTTGEVRNSIVASGTDTIDCTGLVFDSNVVDTAGLSGSNNDVLAFDPGWFPGIAMSDFHVAAGPPFAEVAQWNDGDPLTDIDGDARPTNDGDPDYAGADVP
ncbi:MAG: right-handed parallel beta-helix repeat-containing protein [Myxococcales bacterium]|nr:right-handed parallel beta-helix repeat-containing protein [Myxococcales bacterium]